MPRSSFRTAPPSQTLAPSTMNFSTKSLHYSPPRNKVSSTTPPCISSEVDVPAIMKTRNVSTPLTNHMKNTGTHNVTCASSTDTFSGIVPNTAASTVVPVVDGSLDTARTRRSPSPFSPPAYRRNPNDEPHPHETFPLPIMDYSQIIPSPHQHHYSKPLHGEWDQ